MKKRTGDLSGAEGPLRQPRLPALNHKKGVPLIEAAGFLEIDLVRTGWFGRPLRPWMFMLEDEIAQHSWSRTETLACGPGGNIKPHWEIFTL